MSQNSKIGAGLGGVVLTAGAIAFGAFLSNRHQNRGYDDAANHTKRHPKGDNAQVGRSVTIRKPRAEMFAFWSDFSNLPQFMENVEAIEAGADGVSTWRIKAPAGQTVAVKTEIASKKQDEVIAWRSVEDSEIETSGEVRYPKDLKQIIPAGLQSIGNEYFAHMKQRFPDAVRFTDKNPFNFFQVGLLAILFPNATIIHCHRDARDTCLSCYFQHFAEAKTMDFTTDSEDLGHFYNGYKRLMDHWNSVLPNRIINVAYEDMVADQEDMSRMLIDRAGLEWDDACLKFNENERGVLTASQWQVRQPIYKTSLERWRKYETELAPLIQVLEEAA